MPRKSKTEAQLPAVVAALKSVLKRGHYFGRVDSLLSEMIRWDSNFNGTVERPHDASSLRKLLKTHAVGIHSAEGIVITLQRRSIVTVEYFDPTFEQEKEKLRNVL